MRGDSLLLTPSDGANIQAEEDQDPHIIVIVARLVPDLQLLEDLHQLVLDPHTAHVLEVPNDETIVLRQG